MKKWIIITISLIITIILLGVGYYLIHRNGTMICTYNNKTDLYEISTKYTITYKNYIVENLNTKEVIKSNDKKMLDEYKFSLETIYSRYYKLKYYDNNISLKDNKLTTITNINYKKLDLKEFISIDSNNKNIISNNKVPLKKIKKIYKDNGAKCVYK